jgi:hypothetical protein
MNDLPADSNAKRATQPTSNPPAPRISDSALYKEPKSKRFKRYCNRNLPKAPIWIEAACALALVGITFAYTHYAAGQLREMRKATKATENAAHAAALAADTADATLKSSQKFYEIDQRAWAGVNRVGETFLNANQPPSFALGVTNSGRTPALKLRARVGTAVLRREAKFTPVYPHQGSEHDSGISTIQPGGYTELKWSAPSVYIESLREEIKTGSKTLYLFADIMYRDIFDKARETTFCVQLQYAPHGAPWEEVTRGIVHPDYQWISCGTYNDAN